MSKNPIPEKFRPFFWDADFDELDTDINKLFIISRLYCKGGLEGMYWVEHHYVDADIIEAAKRRRDLNPIVANHLRKKYDLEKSEMNYYSMSADWRKNVL
ncbi:MAG: hypothetical protein IKP86_11395 [Anaerolineaceae bacterium]|nr:hypothetical protein [Anaerolineaceae bacterium]